MIDKNSIWFSIDGSEKTISMMSHQQLTNTFFFLLSHKSEYSTITINILYVVESELKEKYNGKLLSYIPINYSDELKHLHNINSLEEHSTFFYIILDNKNVGRIEKPLLSIDDL